MRKYRPDMARYICTGCGEVYEALVDELINTKAYCLQCDSPLIRARRPSGDKYERHR